MIGLLLLKLASAIFLACVLYRLAVILSNYREFVRLRSEGVTFCANNTYSFWRDLRTLRQTSKRNPHHLSLDQIFKDEFKTHGRLPHMVGRIDAGVVKVCFTSREALQELYITKNQFTDKHWRVRTPFRYLIPQGILF